MASNPSSRAISHYRPDIDGLRAIAVLSVLFYHARLGFPGGYVGVDVFFVISGYLITGLLNRSISTGTFSYRDFWERRVRRLMPALALMTMVTAIPSYFILLPRDLVDFGGALIAQPLLLVNVYFWRVVTGGYFADPPEIRPLLHTWSLGVEEQFYILLPPLLVFILGSHFLKQRLPACLAGMATLSFLLSIAATPEKPVFAFFTLPTRTWELLLGGLLSNVNLTAKWRHLQETMGILGMVMILSAIFGFDDQTSFPGFAAILPCAGTCLVLLSSSGNGASSLGRALSCQPLVMIGLISYSLYLWHWPLLAYAGYLGLLNVKAAQWTLVLASFGLGYCSWKWVETPVRKRQFLSSSRALWGMAALYLGGCLVLGTVYRSNDGYPGRWNHRALAYSEIQRDMPKLLSTDFHLDQPQPPIFLGDQSQKEVSYMVWGDSHARSLVPLLDSLGKEHHLKGLQVTRSGTPPLVRWSGFDKKAEKLWPQVSLREAKAFGIKTVFFVGKWHWYVEKDFLENLEATVQLFQENSMEVILVLDVPFQQAAPPRLLALATKFPIAGRMFTTKLQHAHANEAVNQAVAGLKRIDTSKFRVIDPAPTIFKTNGLTTGDESVYEDKDHLSPAGALDLWPIFEPVFVSLESHSSEASNTRTPNLRQRRN